MFSTDDPTGQFSIGLAASAKDDSQILLNFTQLCTADLALGIRVQNCSISSKAFPLVSGTKNQVKTA